MVILLGVVLAPNHSVQDGAHFEHQLFTRRVRWITSCKQLLPALSAFHRRKFLIGGIPNSVIFQPLDSAEHHLNHFIMQNPMPVQLTALFNAIDARDAQAFAGFLSPDVEFIFANAPAIHGREQVQTAIAGFFASLAGLQHELSASWQTGDDLIMHGKVTYTRLDGSQLCVPFANIFKLRDGLIGEYRIFGDFSALAA